jgi:hypothetical protein
MILSKPLGRMQQAAMKVNVLSPEIYIIAKADALHFSGRQHRLVRKGESKETTPGSEAVACCKMVFVSTWETRHVLLAWSREYGQTSRKGRGCADDMLGVGSADSTLSRGKPCTRGSGRRNGASGSPLGLNCTQRQG